MTGEGVTRPPRNRVGKMHEEKRGLQRSLACLGHPATLVSIGVLLLNDHVLKAAIPSWLTGKLSDFAGLFFFPFIVAACASLLLNRSRATAKQIGYLSFALVAVWFIGLKTLPQANFITARIASLLLGRPAAFALDPTDLIALAVLGPAWLLWHQQQFAAPRRSAYAALCLGAIAAMATSPLPSPTVVEALQVHDGLVYALVNHGALLSKDAGATWTSCHQNECPDSDELGQTRKMPVVVCDPRSPQLCFRVNGNPSIEASTDGGQTWTVAWQLPAGRIPYMHRSAGSVQPEDMAAQDLVIAPGEKSYLLAAMGEAGILRKALPDGEWQWVKFEYSSRIKYTAPYFSEGLLDTASELAIWIAISVVMLIAAGWLLWITLMPENLSFLGLAGWSLWVLFGAAAFVLVTAAAEAAFLALVLSRISLPDWMNTEDFVFGTATVIIYAALFISLVWSAVTIVSSTIQSVKIQKRMLLILFSMAALNCIVSLVVWPFWALGVIWEYNTALLLAGGGSALIAAAGAVLIRRTMAPFESQ